MSQDGYMDGGMGGAGLSDAAVDGLLSSAITPDGAPPWVEDVASLVASASAPSDLALTPRDLQTISDVASVIRATAAPVAVVTRRGGPMRPRMAGAVAVTVAGVVVVGGTAAAVGKLPEPIQHAVASLARDVGVSIPDGDGFAPAVLIHVPPARGSSEDVGSRGTGLMPAGAGLGSTGAGPPGSRSVALGSPPVSAGGLPIDPGSAVSTPDAGGAREGGGPPTAPGNRPRKTASSRSGNATTNAPLGGGGRSSSNAGGQGNGNGTTQRNAGGQGDAGRQGNARGLGVARARATSVYVSTACTRAPR